jgi:catechol 2,3-dioxygenase-like lactoylglutathione lyase family enzyme
MTRTLLSLLLLCGGAFSEELPLLGLAHAGIRVSDLEKARGFYHGVAGFDEAFDTKDPQGGIVVAYFKVNDRQFIEIFPGLRPDDTIPMTHIAMYTESLDKLHKMMQDLGVSPTDIKTGPRDGNRSFSIRKLPGQNLGFLEFVQYMPDSLHVKSVGKSLSDRRISRRLEHAGIVTTDLDAALKFYVNTLGFRETWRRGNPDTGKVALVHLRMPGPSGDYVELSNQTGNPNLTRVRAGTAAHISLEVPDIKVAYQQTLDRGMTEDRKPPRFGLDERWQFNLFDPDGTRVEFMQPRDPAKAGTPVPSR